MNIIRLFLILKFNVVFLILYSPLTFATPPLSVHSQDHPIAVSDTHLYVIRHVTDNKARYSAERSRTYILKLDPRTSRLIEFRKLQDAEQGERPEHSTISANAEFNLFTYLANEKAFQIGLLKPRPHNKITVDKKEGGSLLSRKLIGQVGGKHIAREESSTIYDSNLQYLLKSSLSEIISDYVGPVPDPVPNLEIYSISQNFDPSSGGFCKINKVINAPAPISKWTYEKASDEFIAYVSCRSASHDLYVEAILPLALNFSPAD